MINPFSDLGKETQNPFLDTRIRIWIFTERVPEAFEIPPSDWPENFFSGQSAKRNSRATLMSSYTRLFSAISKIGNGESRNGERGTGNGEWGTGNL